VTADVDPSEWRVETNRGPTSFLLDSEDNVRRLGPNKALVIDTHGIRYLIPDTPRTGLRQPLHTRSVLLIKPRVFSLGAK